MQVTREFIMRGRSGLGGWNRRQIELLGIQYPPREGWVDRAAGQVLSDEDAKLFLDLAGKTKKSQAASVLLSDSCEQCGSERARLAVFRVINGESIVEPTCRDCKASTGPISLSDARNLVREKKLLFIESVE